MARTPQQVREMVFSNNVFDRAETERIYNKYFRLPSRTNRVLLERYALGGKRVLEVGCSYGQGLIWYGAGSVGLDARDYFTNFGNSIGLEMHIANIEAELPRFEQPFDALLCFNVLEHIVAPHLLLMRFRALLHDDGLLCIKVPLTPPPWWWWLYQRAGRPHGFENPEHINFYTPMTARWTLERAGYEIIGQHSPILATLPAGATLLENLVNYLMPSTLVIGKKIANFHYHADRYLEFNPPYAPDLSPYYQG